MVISEAKKAKNKAKRKAKKAAAKKNPGGKTHSTHKKAKKNGKAKARKSTTVRSVDYPSGVGYTNQLGDKPMLMSGSDRMATISVHPTITTTNIQLFGAIVDTSIVPGTRMEVMKTLFTEYRFKRVTLRYEPSAPTTIGAQILALFDYDPNYNPTFGTVDATLNAATAHSTRVISSVFLPFKLNCKLKNDWLYCDLVATTTTTDVVKFSSEGSFFVLQMAPISAVTAVTNDITVGTLYLDWSMEFKGARSPKPITAPPPPIPVAYNDWANFSTLITGTDIPDGGTSTNSNFGWIEFEQPSTGEIVRLMPKIYSDTGSPSGINVIGVPVYYRGVRALLNNGCMQVKRNDNQPIGIVWTRRIPLVGTPIPGLTLPNTTMWWIPFADDTLLDDPSKAGTDQAPDGYNRAVGAVVNFIQSPPSIAIYGVSNQLVRPFPFYTKSSPTSVTSMKTLIDLNYTPPSIDKTEEDEILEHRIDKLERLFRELERSDSPFERV